MSPQEAIDLLSIAARSATWSGASPELARELLEVLRARWDPVVQSVIDERDEARAEVERLKAERLRLLEGTEELGHEVVRLQEELDGHYLGCECRPETYDVGGFESRLAECAAADPKPTPPVDVPDLGPRAKHVEQPLPTGDGQEVFPVALEECESQSLREMLAARDLVGRQRYGTTLKTNNGREAMRDAQEEVADAFLYLTQAIMEGRVTWMLQNARDSLVTAWKQMEGIK